MGLVLSEKPESDSDGGGEEDWIADQERDLRVTDQAAPHGIVGVDLENSPKDPVRRERQAEDDEE